MNRLTYFGIFLFLISSIVAQNTLTPDQSLEALKEGNNRFISGALSDKNYMAEIEATSHGQNPYAVIVTCSDSRVPAETIFDESIGKLFVIRLAGNVIDSSALGSIEYAVKYLNSSYILMLGHTHCGAVHAVVDGGSYSPAITSLAKKIVPAFENVKSKNVGEEDLLDETIEENVYLQINAISTMSEIVSTHITEGTVKIGGGIYDISTGKIHFLEE